MTNKYIENLLEKLNERLEKLNVELKKSTQFIEEDNSTTKIWFYIGRENTLKEQIKDLEEDIETLNIVDSMDTVVLRESKTGDYKIIDSADYDIEVY